MRRIYGVIILCLLTCCLTSCAAQKSAGSEICELPEDSIPAYTIPQVKRTESDSIVLENYNETFTWDANDGTTCSVSVILPALNSEDEFAEEYNSTIKSYADDLLSCINRVSEAAEPSSTVSVSYEAYLNEGLLSILITEQDVSGTTFYQVHTFDLEQKKELTTPELASRLLNLDYPSFLEAGNAFVWQDFFDRYAETEPDTVKTTEIFDGIRYSIPLDTYNLYNRQLFLNEAGDVMLLFQRVLFTEDWAYGLLSEACILPFELEKLDWTASSPEKAMEALLTLLISDRRYYPEFYSYLLQSAFLDSPYLFVEQLGQMDADRADRVIGYLYYAAGDENSVQIQDMCTALISGGLLKDTEQSVVQKFLNKRS